MVSVADVEGAQQAWGEGIVAIAAAHTSGGDFVGIATDHVTHCMLTKWGLCYSNQL